jgi:hypothetical protein
MRSAINKSLLDLAGAPRNALHRVLGFMDDVSSPTTGVITPQGLLSLRQAIDDEIPRFADQPNAVRVLTEARKMADNLVAQAHPDLKVLDATYGQLAKESEALKSGQTLLRTGPEAIRPEDLIAQRAAMSGPEREAQRAGLRAELDRLTGTRANDLTALKQAVMTGGDWNPVKLAEVFGGPEAERIMNAVDREAAFQDAYRKIVENSQTAQRLEAAARIKGQEAPNLMNTTLTGLGTQAAVSGAKKIANALLSRRHATVSEDLANALTKQGSARDDLVRQLREGIARKQRGATTTTRDELVRLLIGSQAAGIPARTR